VFFAENNQNSLTALHSTKPTYFFEHHGGKTIIIARFLLLLRTFAPFVAGVANMTYKRYVVLDFFGGVLWTGSLTLAGYWLGKYAFIKDNLTLVILVIIGLSLLPVFIGYIKHRNEHKATLRQS